MSQTVPMTPEGYQKLQEELKHLIRVERPRVVQDIAEARDHGDLSENAEYDACRQAAAVAQDDLRLARERGVADAQLTGSVGSDPVAGLAELGRLPLAIGKAYDELAILTAWAADNAPSLSTVAATWTHAPGSSLAS